VFIYSSLGLAQDATRRGHSNRAGDAKDALSLLPVNGILGAVRSIGASTG